MRVLIIKQSSLGDVVHCLPALSDAADSIPNFEVDWVVEKNFAEIATWHPNVNATIEIAWRRWRKSLFASETKKEIHLFKQQLQSQKYDLIIDAQGLYKSAILTKLANGRSVGMDWTSIRKEKAASFFYDEKITIPQGQHAVERLRLLFATALNYPYRPDKMIDYRILPNLPKPQYSNYVVGLHGTTWKSKELSKQYWIELASTLHKHRTILLLPHGNIEEKKFAESIASVSENVEVLPPSNLLSLASVLKHALAVFSVDTGLAHLTAALSTPLINVFGATNPKLTAALGQQVEILKAQYHCAPCMTKHCKYSKTNPPCYESISNRVMCEKLETLIKGC